MEEEDWIEGRRLIVAHVTVRASDGTCIVFAPLIATSNRKVDSIVWAFKGYNVVMVGTATIFDPLVLRPSVGKDGVVGSLETKLEPGEN